MCKAEIENHNGAPAIIIDGKPYPPMTATITTCRTLLGKEGRELDFDYYKSLGDAGIRIFYVMCNNLSVDKNAVEEFEEEANTILSAIPDAYIIVRFCLHPSEEWCENNPDEMLQFTDGRELPTLLTAESCWLHLKSFPSLCSQKWRDEMGECMVETIRQISVLPCGERIIGIFLAAGATSEWYYRPEIEDFETGDYGDVSPSFRREFKEFLDKKYGEGVKEPIIPTPDRRYFAEQLDKFILDPYAAKVVRAAAPLPSPESGMGNYGLFVDLDTNAHTLDFYHAWHDGTANSVIHFARLVKENFEGMLVGAFFGGVGACEVFYGSNCVGVEKILDSGFVDFLANPPVYENRQPGGFAGIRQCTDSFRLRNTMYIVEDDTRTHNENDYFKRNYGVLNVQNSIEVLKRDFGRNICNDLQSWWFDQHIGGGRYKSPEIYELFKEQQKIAELAYSLDRKKTSEIAFIFDEQSINAISKQSTFEMVEAFRNYEISVIGAPVDSYLQSDLSNPNMPDYKLYIFANSIYLDDKERETIKAKLRKNNATAIFLYGSGICNPDAKNKTSVQNMSDLLGFNCSAIEKIGSPIFTMRESGETYGEIERKRLGNAEFVDKGFNHSVIYPVIYADDETCTVLGDFVETRKPAVAVKKNDGYTAIYYGAKYISADIIREFAKKAGCHIYEQTGHVLYVNKNFLTLHATHTGEVDIKLPKVCTAYELYEKKNYTKSSDILTLKIKKGETKMFRLI